MFNHHAARTNIGWEAYSRALAIERLDKTDAVSPLVATALSARGIVPLGCSRLPCPCSASDLQAADLIIALSANEHRPLVSERFPDWHDRIEYWEIEDIGFMPADDALKAIEQRVMALVYTLA